MNADTSLLHLNPSQRHSVQSWLDVSGHSGPISSNQSSTGLAFQRWFKFKEAFAPQLVLDVLQRASRKKRVSRCIDPFGGCGTTALTSQFVDVHPVLIEVNPFIADLAEAKLSSYDLDSLRNDFIAVRRAATDDCADHLHLLEGAPATLCEPGNGSRWVFPREVLNRLLQYRVALESVRSTRNRRLLRVLLASIVVGVSNVTVNGKGRKYRGGWEARQKAPASVDEAFRSAFLIALSDIAEFGDRAHNDYDLHRGSCLEKLSDVGDCDLALFSPPYPNSFDYTDIYNLELWLLGYLKSKKDNHRLRNATLRSHVQLSGAHSFTPMPSECLCAALEELDAKRSQLWDDRIPEMIGAYFEDMGTLLWKMHSVVNPGGRVAVVIGDSSYAGVQVCASRITAEIAEAFGWKVERHVKLRSMRLSAQQGGEEQLEERLLELVH